MPMPREKEYSRQESVRRVGRGGLWLLLILGLNLCGWVLAWYLGGH
jgi:hypothetical protein